MSAYTILPMDKPVPAQPLRGKCSGCQTLGDLLYWAEWNSQFFAYCEECAKQRETR